MMLPPGTSCPPNAFTPSRCAFESRPFLELPKPFLCAIVKSCCQWPVASGQLNLFLLLLARLLACGRLCSCLSLRLSHLARARAARALGVGSGAFGLGFVNAERRDRCFLAVELDAGDADGGELLTMSDQLLVLLLALELEDQDLVA